MKILLVSLLAAIGLTACEDCQNCFSPPKYKTSTGVTFSEGDNYFKCMNGIEYINPDATNGAWQPGVDAEGRVITCYQAGY